MRAPCCFLVLALVILAGSAAAGQGPHPAASLRDLRDHFASCFTPPDEAANTRVTFYFSMNAHGGLIGAPRTTWLGFAGSPQARDAGLGRFARAFDGCLPVALDRRLAATLPGEVFYLQYVVGRGGRGDQVLLRPFGSHGGAAPGIVVPREPAGPREIEPPPVGQPSLPPRPVPMHGPTFDRPIAFPPPKGGRY